MLLASFKLLAVTSRLLLYNLIPHLFPFEICLHGFTILCHLLSSESSLTLFEDWGYDSQLSSSLHYYHCPPRDLLFLKLSFGLLITSLHSSYKYAQISPNIKKKHYIPHSDSLSSYCPVSLFLQTHFLKWKPRQAISGFFFSGHSSVPYSLVFAPIMLFLTKYQ